MTLTLQNYALNTQDKWEIPATTKTENFTADSIVNNSVRKKLSKSMDMHFYWIQDRIKNDHFHVFWKPCMANPGECFTKHHLTHQHR